MNNAITFCLFGDNEDYFYGAIKNAQLAEEIYPGWACIFYVFLEVPNWVILELGKYSNVHVIVIPKTGGFYSTMSRFLLMGDSTYDFVISRDCDSRLSHREKKCVEEWINRNEDFHIIYDHPYHYSDEYPILAGMCGFKSNAFPLIGIQNEINFIIKTSLDKKGIDQKLLHDLYHKEIKFHNHLVSDMMNVPRNFERDKIYFIGQQFDKDDNFSDECKNHLKLLGIDVY